ncbi:MAG: ribosome recycling factor [Rickettsiales bacterium]|jgi:ribosome recycling factor|nr:ribosome recycling factor [Rickettsiales bacterium]
MQDILNESGALMQAVIEFLVKDLDTISTGRAMPSLLDKVRVECYGGYSPISSVAHITVLDSLNLFLEVWDRSIVGNVEKAILTANLGFGPVVEGASIRVSIPRLSEERRKELCKIIKKYGEEKKISLRNIRKESLDKIKKIKNNFGEDLVKNFEKKIQDVTDKYVKNVDDLVAAKEKLILTV